MSTNIIDNGNFVHWWTEHTKTMKPTIKADDDYAVGRHRKDCPKHDDAPKRNITQNR